VAKSARLGLNASGRPSNTLSPCQAPTVQSIFGARGVDQLGHSQTQLRCGDSAKMPFIIVEEIDVRDKTMPAVRMSGALNGRLRL
jgi:hypothetical protein